MKVTFEQAKKLKELGFYPKTRDFYHAGGILSCETTLEAWNEFLSAWAAPSVCEALQWIRDSKNIPCSVHLEFEVNNKEWFYYGEWGFKGGNKVFQTGSFSTYPEAESALLDELLTYLENK